MAAHIPDKFRDLVSSKKAFANLATVSSNGAPQVTPVWVDSQGDTILINSAKGRLKDRNMRKEARVALSIEATTQNEIGMRPVADNTARSNEGCTARQIFAALDITDAAGRQYPLHSSGMPL